MEFKCDYNKHNFSTLSYEEYQNHIASIEHEHTGSTSCKDCGQKNIPFKTIIKLQPFTTPPAYCDECKDRLKKELLG